MKPLVECHALTKLYGARPALDHIDLEIGRGRIVGLLGPNGSGKTTLIKLMTGLLVPSSGDVLIDGMKPGKETSAIVSYLPERTYLTPEMKVIEAVEYFHDFYADFVTERAYEMLNQLGIAPEDRLKNLSKGTREKVQLILVMSRDAKLYLLDEPIAGVDPAARDYILNTILKNYNREATIVLSTHLISDVQDILDDVIFLRYGKVILQAAAAPLMEQNNKTIDQIFREVFVC